VLGSPINTIGTCPLTSNTVTSSTDTIVYTCAPGTAESSPAQDIVIIGPGTLFGLTGAPIETVVISGVTIPSPTDVIYGFSPEVPNGGVATAAAPFCVSSGQVRLSAPTRPLRTSSRTARSLRRSSFLPAA
jgi:hypothetical protein